MPYNEVRTKAVILHHLESFQCSLEDRFVAVRSGKKKHSEVEAGQEGA
jgi:hypothetical protein